MIIAGSYVLPMHRPSAVIRNGAVAVRGNTILAVGPFDSLSRRFPSHRVTALHNSVLMPGLVNAHVHIELPPLLDSIRASSFPGWILNLIAAKKKLTVSDYASAAAANIKTLIATGTTALGEICTHDVSPLLLKRSGLRAVVYREIIGMQPNTASNPIVLPLSGRDTSRVHFGFSPHAPYTVSGNTLRSLAPLAKSRNIPLTMHVAESADELHLLLGRKSELQKLYAFAKWDIAWAPSACSSFRYLQDVGILSSNLLAVHAVHVKDDDINLMRRSHCSIAHCPRSNRELGVGRMLLRKLLDAGIPVGLGTDSLASNSSLSMWDEMRSAYQIHRRHGITPEQIMILSTKGGAQALRLPGAGILMKGNKADIIAAPLPTNDTGDLFRDVLRETKSCIFSMVDGKVLRCQRDS